MNPELPDTSYREFLLLILRKRKRFRVTGKSMQPLLEPGEEILINPNAYLQSLPQVNDIVVVTHPNKPNLKIVKRIVEIRKNNTYFIQGDNLRQSTDSRSFGTVNFNLIRGKVTNRFG
ncbi:MAG: nickel-type superoxide dismutase maturation protease [Xenococcus sp. MO_188.B8]|nr:nickel-type superoxide dismutase maturation protease [Xenococcus sp. MO_188.B8]